MKIYSDTLTTDDLYAALPRGCDLELDRITRPRKRSNGYTVRLSSVTGTRRRNSGVYGAEETRAASWDEHGEWMARLFDIDTHAVIAIYDGRSDFTLKTDGAFADVVR